LSLSSAQDGAPTQPTAAPAPSIAPSSSPATTARPSRSNQTVAGQKTIKACQEKWRANKATNQANGITALPAAPAALTACSSCTRAKRARSMKRFPAAVSRTPPECLSKSDTPRLSSSDRTRRLTVDCRTPRTLAARRKLRQSATISPCVIETKSMPDHPESRTLEVPFEHVAPHRICSTMGSRAQRFYPVG
jgi:hypothetical protein